MGNDAVDFDTAWNLLKVVGAGGRGSARESANALPRRASPGGTPGKRYALPPTIDLREVRRRRVKPHRRLY